MDRSNYILGTIKLKKKKPFYDIYKRTFRIGRTTTYQESGLPKEHWLDSYKSSYSGFRSSKNADDKVSMDCSPYKFRYAAWSDDEYGSCYFDKKNKCFVRTNYLSDYERNMFGEKGLGCSTWLCRSKKVRDDYYMKYTPSNILEYPAIIDVDDFDKRYKTSLYKKEKMITLESDGRGAINAKKDKIEASLFSDHRPSFFDGDEDSDWSLIILFLAYVYRAIISIITGIIFFIRWLIRTSISN